MTDIYIERERLLDNSVATKLLLKTICMHKLTYLPKSGKFCILNALCVCTRMCKRYACKYMNIRLYYLARCKNNPIET